MMLLIAIVGALLGALCLAARFMANRRGARRGCRVIGFLHPDLGIGGAERLVIDAAVGLQKSGRRVIMFTAHHNPEHCFSETRDGTLEVVTAGSWLPRHILGKGHVLFATLRMLWLTLYCIYAARVDIDAFIVDQVSLPLSILRWLSDIPTVFYCHFPDKLCDPTLLAQAREQLQKQKATGAPASAGSETDAHLAPYKLAQDKRGLLRKCYRLVFDYVEEACLSHATRIVFNSGFTKSVTLATFPSLDAADDAGDVLYPPINVNGLESRPAGEESQRLRALDLGGKRVILSINRFEHQKNLPLAIDAYYEALARLGKTQPAAVKDVVLVMSGGYDARLPNQVACLQELKDMAARCRAEYTAAEGSEPPAVAFLTSFSEVEKYDLLKAATALLYTPTGEHFGIVPLESMYCGVPVIAARSAGPLETVVHRKTGFLQTPDTHGFADAITELLCGTVDTRAMAADATEHVNSKFSHKAFTAALVRHITDVTN